MTTGTSGSSSDMAEHLEAGQAGHPQVGDDNVAPSLRRAPIPPADRRTEDVEPVAPQDAMTLCRLSASSSKTKTRPFPFGSWRSPSAARRQTAGNIARTAPRTGARRSSLSLPPPGCGRRSRRRAAARSGGRWEAQAAAVLAGVKKSRKTRRRSEPEFPGRCRGPARTDAPRARRWSRDHLLLLLQRFLGVQEEVQQRLLQQFLVGRIGRGAGEASS